MALAYQVKAPNVSRSLILATIAEGESVTGTIDLSYTALTGFVLPAEWTAAGVSVEVSVDGTNWATGGIQDFAGNTIGIWSSGVANGAYAIDLASMVCWNYCRIRSGTYGTPIAQAAARVISVVTRPLA